MRRSTRQALHLSPPSKDVRQTSILGRLMCRAYSAVLVAHVQRRAFNNLPNTPASGGREAHRPCALPSLQACTIHVRHRDLHCLHISSRFMSLGPSENNKHVLPWHHGSCLQMPASRRAYKAAAAADASVHSDPASPARCTIPPSCASCSRLCSSRPWRPASSLPLPLPPSGKLARRRGISNSH